VRAFQRDRGMVPDGIAGPKTWAALDAVSPVR
jgi:peptidoglycan hydrolase-like protein with peptidoglycan-binding domain